jgi:hypothetical protein
MTSWVVQSGFLANSKVVVKDAAHAATALEKASTSASGLHTVCAVLLEDTESANASLPTPDNRATTLLSNAYTELGAGANECYNASASASKRAAALQSLTSGLGKMSEASARIASDSTP